MNTTPVESPEERLELLDVALALLSFAAGAMDALAFFSLGEVFPSAMTGNTALLGLALGQGHLTRASRPFVAFVGFLAGGALASASLELKLQTFDEAASRMAAPRARGLPSRRLHPGLGVRRPADRRPRRLSAHYRGVLGDGDTERRGSAARPPGDHDRRLHQHADLDRGHDDPGLSAAAAPPAPLRLAADRHVLDLWPRRRNLRPARHTGGMDRGLASLGRSRRRRASLARRSLAAKPSRLKITPRSRRLRRVRRRSLCTALSCVRPMSFGRCASASIAKISKVVSQGRSDALTI